jgi:hypothetical protein
MPSPAALPDVLRRPCLPALLLTAALVSACPGPAAESEPPPKSYGGGPHTVGVEEQAANALPPRRSVNYPPMVVDYVAASLRNPATDEHAALAQTWDAIAHLADGSAFTAQLTEQLGRLADAPPVELVGAWLAADPEAAGEWIAARVKEEKYLYLQSLEAQPTLGRYVLRRLALDLPNKASADGIMDLLRDWEPLDGNFAELLDNMDDFPEPRTRLRAIGYLLALGKASDGQLAELKEALHSHKINELSAAAEACRISGDERLASALVNHAALTPAAADEGKGESQPGSTNKYAAYALTFLPGEQAALLRRKLLEAKDEQVQWQARLGELLHGDPKPWYDALLKTKTDNPALWLALQPVGVADPALLLTYQAAAASKNAETRLKAAQQLNRYGAHASDKLVRQVLIKLMADDVEQVAAEAWRSAALLRLDGFGNTAQQLLDDPKQLPSLRLGAAFYQLKLAEPRPAQEGAG